jgi:hypothetical protein
MSCCGKARTSVIVQSSTRPEPLARPAPSSLQASTAGQLVEYVGSTGLTVRGPASGHVYRFANAGARMLVDGRDAPFLLAIPVLKKKQDVR